MPLKGLDITLGMDWLNLHKAVIDCANKIVSLEINDGEWIVF